MKIAEALRRIIGLFSSLLLKRSLLFAVLNTVYFGAILIASFLAQFMIAIPYNVPFEINRPFFAGANGNILFLFLGIFLFNLCVSSFLLGTLPGLLFFAFPFILMVTRATLLGFLLNQLSTRHFLLTLPVVALEGEAYILASLAGVVLGLSWLRPSWLSMPKNHGRLEALKTLLPECLCWYGLVVLLLFLAALIEVWALAVAL